jgi:hypothetical protein
MTPQDSNMAANAICYAATMAQEAIRQAAYAMTEASVLYRPRLFQDGDQWCALLGDDLQVGVCGFGSTPANAIYDFNCAWNRPLPKKGGAL